MFHIRQLYVFNELLRGPTVLLIFMIMYLTNYYYEAPRRGSNLGPMPLSLLDSIELFSLAFFPIRTHEDVKNHCPTGCISFPISSYDVINTKKTSK